VGYRTHVDYVPQCRTHLLSSSIVIYAPDARLPRNFTVHLPYAVSSAPHLEEMQMKPVHLVTLLGLAGLSALWAPAVAPAATHIVNPGDSIQAAVDAALAGDTVKVMPGDYTDAAPTGSAAVRITKPLKLIAKSNLKKNIKVRILPGAGQTDGIVVKLANPGDPDIVGIQIKGFTVEGFPNNGIWLEHVQKFTASGRPSRQTAA